MSGIGSGADFEQGLSLEGAKLARGIAALIESEKAVDAFGKQLQEKVADLETSDDTISEGGQNDRPGRMIGRYLTELLSDGTKINITIDGETHTLGEDRE